MKTTRDPEYLKFIRSLPCCVCFRTRTIETAHVGRRGMGQKSSDRETIPLCSLHHREQHRIGLRQFSRDYELNIPQLLAQLNEKPRIRLRRTTDVFLIRNVDFWNKALYVCEYRDACFYLLPVEIGLDEAVALAKQHCREYLIEQLFTSNVRR